MYSPNIMTATTQQQARHLTPTRAQSSGPILLRPLVASLLLALAGNGPAAWAQTTRPSFSTNDGAPAGSNGGPAAAPSAGAGPARNNYGDILKPTVKRAAGKANELYNPIKRQDDAAQIPEIEMFVGESRVFPTPGVARIAVGNGQIMSAAALDEKEVIVFANGVGTSSLFVWNEDGRYQRVKVNIVPGDTSRVAREVAAFLSAMPNAKASIVGDKVIVEGDSLSDEERDKISELAKRYPQIVNFTSAVGWEKMVMMDVKVVEFPKTELRELGLKWTASGGATLAGVWAPVRYGKGNGANGYQVQIPSNGSGLPITDRGPDGSAALQSATLPSALNILGAMNMGIGAKLNLLEQNGTASILAEPQLSARNGSKASFLAGGEFPYSVSNNNGVTIIFKPYGIKLDIEPKIGRDGIIRASIESEVSSIDSSVSTAAGPALLTRRTKTEFNVNNGETIVLSGLLQRNTSNDVDKVPLLGEIPILGALFRSKRFQNKETELVVFVTPSIVDSRSPGLVDRVERATERLGQNLGKSPYLTAPLQPGHDPAKTNQQPLAPAPVAAMADALPLAAAPPAAAPAPARVAARSGVSLQVKRDGLVLRAEPRAGSAALLELGYNSIVQLGTADAQPPGQSLWRNVVVGQLNGWVPADGVEPTRLQAVLKTMAKSVISDPERTLKPSAPELHSPTGRAVTPTAASAGAAEQYRVVLKGLALRVSPDINAQAIRVLDENQLVQALPQAGSGNWIAVQAGTQRGWVAAQWLHAVAQAN